MSTVTLDMMRDRLISLDEVGTLLAQTEPLTSQDVNSNSKVHFILEDGWNEALDEVKGTDPVAVSMRINGTEQQMTKDAALMAAANVGLPGAYVRKAPGSLIEPHLNYWYANLEKEYTALSVADRIAAFTRPTITPFSNINLLESAVAGIRARYGNDTEILADYKIFNTLEQTDVRLIVPEQQRAITDGGMRDVPQGQADLWSAGIHLSNSLIGKKQTAVEAYLFRWWCTNGATTTMGDVGTWSRRSNGQESDIYTWAQESVDEVLGGMEHKFDEIQAMTALNVAGNTADVIRQIFTDYEVPVSQREQITQQLLESENLTMYTIMNAITLVANQVEDPRRSDRLMRIGGAIPTTTFDTIKAQVWAEGHTADEQAQNPYVIVPVTA